MYLVIDRESNSSSFLIQKQPNVFSGIMVIPPPLPTPVLASPKRSNEDRYIVRTDNVMSRGLFFLNLPFILDQNSKPCFLSFFHEIFLLEIPTSEFRPLLLDQLDVWFRGYRVSPTYALYPLHFQTIKPFPPSLS